MEKITYLFTTQEEYILVELRHIDKGIFTKMTKFIFKSDKVDIPTLIFMTNPQGINEFLLKLTQSIGDNQ